MKKDENWYKRKTNLLTFPETMIFLILVLLKSKVELFEEDDTYMRRHTVVTHTWSRKSMSEYMQPANTRMQVCLPGLKRNPALCMFL